MSQEACTKFEPQLPDGALMLIDEDFVRPQRLNKTVKIYGIQATRIAETLGRKIVANIVMLGFFTAITKVVTPEAMKQAISTTVPQGTTELNLSAMQRGYDHGMQAKLL
jgi:2-oxoglutarate ferredoxin oxidoreductase subunit gamma